MGCWKPLAKEFSLCAQGEERIAALKTATLILFLPERLLVYLARGRCSVQVLGMVSMDKKSMVSKDKKSLQLPS